MLIIEREWGAARFVEFLKMATRIAYWPWVLLVLSPEETWDDL
jgi:hypothetical protein